MGVKIRNSEPFGNPVNWVLVCFLVLWFWYLGASVVAGRTCKNACDAAGYETSHVADMSFWWFSTSKCKCSNPVFVDTKE